MDFLVPKQWGLTNKKIILFNFDNFWDHQLRQFDKMVETNALQQKHLDLLTVVTTVDECIQILCETKTSDLHDLDTRYWEKED
jgi:predicted Rossmann-fold nucleotide-binding protein